MREKGIFKFYGRTKAEKDEKQALNRKQALYLKQMADKDLTSLYTMYHSSPDGLSEEQAESNIKCYGINKLSRGKKKSLCQKLGSAFISPFTMILLVLALVSTLTDIVFPIFRLFGQKPEDFDCITVVIIVMMVVLSGILRFIQESRSGDAADKLLSLITTTCSVLREKKVQEIPLDEVAVGDVVLLSTGDMLPADVRIIEAHDFFVNQSAMTGESEPIEKHGEIKKIKSVAAEEDKIAYMGTSVVSGSAKALVIAVGDQTLFGAIASTVSQESGETSFSRGVNAVSLVLIRFMLVMVPIVFVVNGVTKGNWLSAFLFAISIAVGLTPEMLPMIVTTCLSKGAISMSRKKTIVKNLNSIQNFGSMDILCTDKTGTLTQDRVVLQWHLNVNGEEDMRVLRHAYLNSYFQTGYKNLMDLAIIKKTEQEEKKDPTLIDLSENYHKIDEIPFDFTRRRLTTVVEDKKGKTQMVTKGAVEEMLDICKYVECNGKVLEMNDDLGFKIRKTVDQLNEKGFRVLALAQKTYTSTERDLSVKDEKDMVLLGYLAFLDPPKESAMEAIKALKKFGVQTKILTGDNDKVTRTICDQVGIEVRSMLLGSDLENMTDEELEECVDKTDVFAKLTPDQKANVVEALRKKGHTVGFMGDGINDAPAMKKADIGISVDTAVDIAKESADIILLEKDLMVLHDGIIEGRKTYANMIKYIKMTASSNFGNMFSVLAASALLPFLPMESLQLLFLNLIYDLSCSAIPWDNVDQEFILKPRNWDASSVGKFMLWLGPTSSLFDFSTYLFMYFVLCPFFVSHGILYHDLANHFSGAQLLSLKMQYMALFQTGWFVESMWSQTLVIHMIRTPKLPFIQSRASSALTLLTCSAILLVTLLPFTPIGAIFGFRHLPMLYFAYLVPCIILYMIFATGIKKAYVRRYKELL